MRISSTFFVSFILFLMSLNINVRPQATSDPASLPVYKTVGTITLDGLLNEPDWQVDKPYMRFRIGGTPSGNAFTPTNFVVVKQPYRDTSACNVKFLRDGMNLYFSLNSDDKQVCRFDWEGDGMFMKIKNSQGNDLEYKIYVGVVNNIPQFVFETNGPANSGSGIGVPKTGTTIYDSTNTDNGYTAELVINLANLGFTTVPQSVSLMINIFDPDHYSLGAPPWGPNGNFAKQWWGSEWGGTYRTLTLLDLPVPVELVSLAGSYIGSYAKIEWTTATELNNKGFEIQRSTDGENFSAVNFVNGAGTTTEMQNYSYVDRDIKPLTNYYYRLKQIDFDGNFEYSSVLNLGTSSPFDFELEQNYPNPFNPTTNISFVLKEASTVNIDVFNVIGEKIATLLNEKVEVGKHTIKFDASSLPTGNYIYRLNAVTEDGKFFTSTKKMLLIK